MNFNKVIEEYGYPVISKEISGHICNARLCIKYNDGRYQSEYDMFTKENKNTFHDLRRYAYMLNAPFKISNKCCNVMKKSHFMTMKN